MNLELAPEWMDAPDAEIQEAESPLNGNGPMVILPSGPIAITQSATELFKIVAPTHRVFTRGRAVVIVRLNMDNIAVLELLRPSAARSFFESYTTLFAWRSGKNGG